MTQSLKMVGLVGWAVPAQQAWRKGPWTPEEDKLLTEYVTLHGEGRWSSVARCTGLSRTGKSCRLRWVNYLRPGLKKGQITPQEEGIIIELHALWGNKWSTIARYLPGRTDNEIKNYWRTHFKKERSTRKTSQQRQKTRNPNPKASSQVEETKPREASASKSEELNQVTTESEGKNKEENMLMYPNPNMEEQQNLSSSWMEAMCQDQEGWWWWNLNDEVIGGRSTDEMQQHHHQYYCSKMALSAQNNQAAITPTNNIVNNNNNGISWGGDPIHLYNGSYIF